MNILLFLPQNIVDTHEIKITGRQCTHLLRVLNVSLGSQVRIGLLNGNIGTGTVTKIEPNTVHLSTELTTLPPANLPLSLVIALPRPQMIKRILQTVATMGVDQVHFVQTKKVEKNYWQSPTVEDDAIFEQLHLGLEQGVSTRCPQVFKHTCWRTFVNESLPVLTEHHDHSFVAHLTQTARCPSFSDAPATKSLMFIGPEGGFTPEEISTLNQKNIKTVQLGNRVMKVETAVTAVITKLYL